MSEVTGPLPHDVRASDAERERTITLLRDHAADGRLDADELAERVGRADSAATRSELTALTKDLPVVEPTPERERRPLRTVLRGELGAFVLVNILLVAIWAASGAGYFWPIWPLLGWGIGIVGCGSGRRGGPFRHMGGHRKRPCGVVRRSAA
ncbi:MAG: DUF1707 domain-containing protein [Thermoleophilaceae bacterium]